VYPMYIPHWSHWSSTSRASSDHTIMQHLVS
jgi:hypothetical protein